jgi:hypothetical protein
MTGTSPADKLAQGDIGLLRTPTARDLLQRAIPARMAYVARDGSPRIVPTWFHWDGHEIAMATWVRGPHVHHPARRIEDLRRRPDVALSIDTDDQPPAVLQVRGRATVEVVEGIPTAYRLAAQRYLGPEAAAQYLAQLDEADVSMARIAVRPEWVGLVDFQERQPGPLGGVG